MMQSDQAGGSNPSTAPELPASDAGPGPAAAAANMADKAKNQIAQVGSQAGLAVQGFAAHPLLPVVCRAWIFLFSLLSWTITASLTSLGSATNFQLAVGVIIWLFAIFWLVVEVSLLKDISLPIMTGSVIMNRVEIYSDAVSGPTPLSLSLPLGRARFDPTQRRKCFIML